MHLTLFVGLVIGFAMLVAIGGVVANVAIADTTPARRLLLAIVIMLIVSATVLRWVAATQKVYLGDDIGTLELVSSALAITALLALSVEPLLRHFAKRRPSHAHDSPEPNLVDHLTSTASHRAFQDRLVHECERAYRFADNFALIMLDLDSFHPVNNRHGHRTGDHILISLAKHLKAQLREIDLLARFGGDQFAVILPHTTLKGALDAAERLRHTVASWTFVSPEGCELRLTASVGVCVYPEDGKNAQELVDAAQTALTLAKNMGGNQVRTYKENRLPFRLHKATEITSTDRSAIVRGLAAAVDLRDGYTHEHSRAVSALAAAIARHFGLPATDISRITEAALLHDVGKIGIPDTILTKRGGLSPDEWESIKQHPVLGKEILEQFPELVDVVPLVLYHQERYDGTGYPARLKGAEIPLGARIIAAADAYHAIRSDRPYRAGRTHEEAVQELIRCSGKQFDPEVVGALVRVINQEDFSQDLIFCGKATAQGRYRQDREVRQSLQAR